MAVSRFCCLVFVALFLKASVVFSQTPWEVVVMYLGGQITDGEHQGDIDWNIMELGNSLSVKGSLLPGYRLTLYREFKDRSVTYVSDWTGKALTPWDSLFFEAKMPGLGIDGRLTAEKKGSDTRLLNEDWAKSFFKEAFRDPEANRLLLIYGHGYAFQGMQGIELNDLHRNLVKALPVSRRHAKKRAKPLEILWVDACFMANLETVYELKDLAHFYVSSEEAEFSAGTPLETLRILTRKPDDAREVALKLANEYIASYSVEGLGSNRNHVYVSSATISVIDTQLLPALVKHLKEVVERFSGRLTDEQKATLERSRKPSQLLMEEGRYAVDLGNLARWFKMREESFDIEEVQQKVDDIVELLDLNRDHKTNQRVPLVPQKPNQWVVYGYNGWNDGHKKDDQGNDEQLPPNLKPEGYLPGPGGIEWPFRTVPKRLYVSPFSRGRDIFHYYFVSPDDYDDIVARRKPLPQYHTVFRKDGKDYAIFVAKNTKNPILFSGYTQGRGNMAEKYSGLSILYPGQDHVPAAYSYLAFSKETRWEKLLFLAGQTGKK